MGLIILKIVRRSKRNGLIGMNGRKKMKLKMGKNLRQIIVEKKRKT